MKYAYSEGANGEHWIDIMELQQVRVDTLGRAVTKTEALRIIEHLNNEHSHPKFQQPEWIFTTTGIMNDETN